MNENKMKNLLIMMYNASTFKRKRNKKKRKEKKRNGIKLRRSQVMLYVDQRGRVKQKSDNLSSN